MPGPQSVEIKLSSQQREILERLARKNSSPRILVQRIRIVLNAAAGMRNQQIARELKVQRPCVILWRKRWAEAAASLAQAETEKVEPAQLEALIVKTLADEPRPGAPGKFEAEQIARIMAIACEKPEEEAGRPVTHWTPRELRLEVLKRGIVEEISVRTIGRFLKRCRSEAASEPLLAERPPQGPA